LPASVTPTSAGNQSRNALDWTHGRGRHGALKVPPQIRAGLVFLHPHRYLCVRYWKPQVLRLSGDLNYEMAISDFV